MIYFYPKDDTPGCTKQAIGFSCIYDQFKAAGVEVIGVSKDSAASHAKFKKKHDLAFPLGSDAEGAVVEAFGAWVEKSMYGKKYMGIDRATFLVGAGRQDRARSGGRSAFPGMWRRFLQQPPRSRPRSARFRPPPTCCRPWCSCS